MTYERDLLERILEELVKIRVLLEHPPVIVDQEGNIQRISPELAHTSYAKDR